jgi:inosine-uridine nucleoside N-ribohydrolase
MTDVVLDVDTGVDDALALLVAVRHPAPRVRAISCVEGNVGVEQVVFNTLTVLEHAGAPDIPVAAGAHRPLVAPARATHEDAGARLAGMLCRHQIAVCGHDPRLAGDALIGDAGAVCAVADPAGLVIARLPVQVELAPGLSRGQTIVDRRPVPGEEEVHGLSDAAPRHDVALGVDDARYRSLFLETAARRAARPARLDRPSRSDHQREPHLAGAPGPVWTPLIPATLPQEKVE